MQVFIAICQCADNYQCKITWLIDTEIKLISRVLSTFWFNRDEKNLKRFQIITLTILLCVWLDTWKSQ